MKKREYDFIEKEGVYTICLTHYTNVGVFGVGSTDRKKALKQAREYCRNSIATLHIKA